MVDIPAPDDYPIIGPWIGRLGKIDALYATPCDPTPAVYAKAAWAAAPLMLWTLFKPDAEDLLTGRFFQHHKKRRRRRFRVGGRVHGTPGFGLGKRWVKFLVPIALKERLGWYFILVDAISAFQFNWASLAYAWQGCKSPDIAYCNLRGDGSNRGSFGNYNQIFHGWQVVDQNIFMGDNNSIVIPQGYFARLSLETSPEQPDFGVPLCNQFATTMFNSRNAAQQMKGGGNAPFKPGFGIQLNNGWWEASPPFQEFMVRLELSQGFTKTANWRFSAYGSRAEGLDPDP